MATPMRAKLRIGSIVPNIHEEKTTSEYISFHGVPASEYPEDGSDENNTFARFSPSVNLDIMICNPNLFGKFSVGEDYYVDFKPVE